MIFYSILWIILLTLRVVIALYLRAERKHYQNKQAPTISTYSRYYDLMSDKLVLKPDCSCIDLWCGDGSVLRFFAHYYKTKKLVGIDNNRVAIWLGKIYNWISNKSYINLVTGDFQSIDISNYDVIYLFLLPQHLDNMKIWLQNNIKPDAMIVCSAFEFSSREPCSVIQSEDKRSTIRIYKKPKSKQ